VIATPVLLLVLLAALLHAGWNFLVKAGADRLLDTMGVAVGASLIAGCLLPFVPLPAPASWPWLTATVCVHVGYFTLLVATYNRADLSLAYPVMRGAAPLLVAAACPLLGEPVSAGLLLGVALVGCGIMLPAWIGLRRGIVGMSSVGLALANSFVIALYTVWDGFGVRVSGSALSYTLWLFFLNSWSILAIALWRRSAGAVFAHFRRHWLRTAFGAAMTIGSYGIALWAMTQTQMAAVAALRETSVVFATILGAVVLKEALGPWRMLGAAAVAVGVAVVRLG
jgi:drug/metabolite transporter (DMT)-like permease